MRPILYLKIAITAALLAAGTIMIGSRWAGRPEIASRMNFVMERKTAARVAQGQPVAMTGHMHEWMLRWRLAERILAAPDVAVFGSSHSLGVSAAVLGATHPMNFSISGSSLPDHFATAGILEARKLRPARWVIFVDAWLFDRGADYGAWYLQADAVLRMEAELAGTPPPLEKIFTGNRPILSKRERPLFSLEPLLRALDGIAEEYLLRAEPAETGRETGQVLAVDGSLAATADSHPPSPAAVEALALRQFLERPDRHRYGGYNRVDLQLWDYFERWVQHCRAQGGDVWLVLSPYHPAAYPRIIQMPGNQLQAVEARVRDFSRRAGVPLIGSYDPVRAGVSADLFFDGDHLREEGLRQLLAPLRDSGGPRPTPP